jgi:hypothetical protein
MSPRFTRSGPVVLTHACHAAAVAHQQQPDGSIDNQRSGLNTPNLALAQRRAGLLHSRSRGSLGDRYRSARDFRSYVLRPVMFCERAPGAVFPAQRVLG